MTPQTVFLGCITHDGRIDMKTATALYTDASKEHNVLLKIHQSSLLAKNCNELWCDALNLREKHNLKWFALLHSDVRPEPFFLDKMIAIAEKHDAHMLSVALPIKDHRGLTSTAVSHRTSSMHVAGRITQTQLRKLPATFSINDVLETLPNDFPEAGNMLLANTGLMIVRIDMDFSKEVFFTINDAIVQAEDGTYVAQVEPEDWFFSKCVQAYHGRVLVTREVQAYHVGNMEYNNQAVWGNETDK